MVLRVFWGHLRSFEAVLSLKSPENTSKHPQMTSKHPQMTSNDLKTLSKASSKNPQNASSGGDGGGWNLKPPHLNSQISSLTKLKNLKYQISNLKSSILNSQTSNLKTSNLQIEISSFWFKFSDFKFKPQTSAFQFSNSSPTKLKNLKSQTSNLQNLKISNPKSLGWAAWAVGVEIKRFAGLNGSQN